MELRFDKSGASVLSKNSRSLCLRKLYAEKSWPSVSKIRDLSANFTKIHDVKNVKRKQSPLVSDGDQFNELPVRKRSKNSTKSAQNANMDGNLLELRCLNDYLTNQKNAFTLNSNLIVPKRPRCISKRKRTESSINGNGSLNTWTHSNKKKAEEFNHWDEGKNVNYPSSSTDRVLRPKKQFANNFIKRRRRFYEVFSSDIDPYWVVKQRISVFWPLDKNWYFGTVREYNPKTKLHFIKYDDQDEEWVNLRNERFKLLLYPSEVAGKSLPQKPELESELDNDPLISWLAKKSCKVSNNVAFDASSSGKNTSISFVYFRRRFHKSNLNSDRTKPNFLKLEFSIPIEGAFRILFWTEGFQLLRQNFLSDYGKLVLIYPTVQMEITVVDNHLGLRIFSFKGYLMRAVTLVCLILSKFCKRRRFIEMLGVKTKSKMELELETKIPCTSIGIKLSGLCGNKRKELYFMIYRCKELQESEWDLIETYLREQNCFSMRKLSLCKLSNKTNLLSGSVFDVPSQHISAELQKLKPQTIYFDERISKNSHLIPVTSVFSSMHLKLLTDKIASSSLNPEKSNSALSENIWEEHNKTLKNPNLVSPTSVLCPNPNSYGYDLPLKKPRTRVSYTPITGTQSSTGFKNKTHYRKKQIWKQLHTETKQLHTETKNRIPEFSSCFANILLTSAERGWRECGAHVSLESDGLNDWYISVKVSGSTRFTHKPYQLVQPGISNRYTHSILWRGGKDWTLEFTDRAHWMMFKSIHEKCYNRNIRSASVRAIPIPGVHLMHGPSVIENLMEKPFVRDPVKYHSETGTEIDRAEDPAHVLYDMDSDDENWLERYNNINNSDNNNCLGGDGEIRVSDGVFERIMDRFEKFAYAKGREEFSPEELEGFISGSGFSSLIIKGLYDYWHQKRQRKGMPLIRQFQPALWEIYEKKIREWESSLRKYNLLEDWASRECNLEREKPPLFAFCLRPRGLDQAPNKGSKQRPHKKFLNCGPHFYSSNNFGVERAPLSISPRNLPFSPRSSLPSPVSFSPRDDSRTGITTLLADRKQRNHNAKRYHESDVADFKLRDAAGAAVHALNVARLKREKAQWLVHKAGLAMHKAAHALVIAEAIETSQNLDEFF